MRPAQRLQSLPLYPFATLNARIGELQQQGMDIIKLDIGAPDSPPAGFVTDALTQSAHIGTRHTYAGYAGTPRLRQAIVSYYHARFGVSLRESDEVLPLIGSKEGIAHMALAWLDAGDVVLVPDPGYPTYEMGARLAGASVYRMPLLSENGFLPDFDAIPATVARKARLMWLNYPNNPTGAVASTAHFEWAVEFCRRNGILLCHDAPYADVTFDGYVAPSILSVPGAGDVCVEFNSLSKSHNMAGWRVGMAVGNALAIGALQQVKTNIDSGIFLPIQDAAAAALCGDQQWLVGRNAEYQRRRDMLWDLLAHDWALEVQRPLAGLYLWPRIPEGYTSVGFAEKVLLEAGVSLTPGTTFGPRGEGYIRISIGQSTDRIAEAVRRLRRLDF